MIPSLLRKVLPFWCQPYQLLRRRIETTARGQVVAGPFQGLQLPAESAFGVYFAKLLGSYELELHPVVQAIRQLKFRTIIDVGAAEGYYACGLGRLLPDARVLAFETGVRGRYLLRETIERNSLEDRVSIHGHCEPADLQSSIARTEAPCLVLCDAEGCEYELLDPARVSGLGNVWILAEVHDFLLPGLSAKLSGRFGDSHIIQEIQPRPRRREDFPSTIRAERWIPERYFNAFTADERPPENFWMWLQPKSEASTAAGAVLEGQIVATPKCRTFSELVAPFSKFPNPHPNRLPSDGRGPG